MADPTLIAKSLLILVLVTSLAAAAADNIGDRVLSEDDASLFYLAAKCLRVALTIAAICALAAVSSIGEAGGAS